MILESSREKFTRAVQILLEIKASSHLTVSQLAGILRTAEGTLYPVLKELEEEGYISPYHLGEEWSLEPGRVHRQVTYFGLGEDLGKIDQLLLQAEGGGISVEIAGLTEFQPGQVSTQGNQIEGTSLVSIGLSPTEIRYRRATEKICKDLFEEVRGLGKVSLFELQERVEQAIRDRRWRPSGDGPLRTTEGVVAQLRLAGWVTVTAENETIVISRGPSQDFDRLWDVVNEARAQDLVQCAEKRARASEIVTLPGRVEKVQGNR